MCRGCELYRDATQTVFGQGRRSAELMLVGEQPGDKEDLEGEPFVGPAGRLLDRALQEAGIDRSDAYVTNAVKHFKWRPRGKRRLHQTPRAKDRGRPLEPVAIHPSAILRLHDHDEREAEFAGFVADLEGVATALHGAAR
ncbi:MAG TPA: uracil-DNA glycosylase family protein [Solirubrobacterales bacterium]|nr:uracil-DNA glycosylase family protein [Solirubrobacterales bacterium]